MEAVLEALVWRVSPVVVVVVVVMVPTPAATVSCTAPQWVRFPGQPMCVVTTTNTNAPGPVYGGAPTNDEAPRTAAAPAPAGVNVVIAVIVGCVA